MATQLIDNDGGGKTVLDVSPDHVFEAGVAPVVVPVGDALLQAEYTRHGGDLQLETPSGETILITGYFQQEVPPDLYTLAGSRITPDVAAKLAGPLAPGQIAQSADISTLEEPIGSVDTLKGQVTVIRADGTQAVLEEGVPLYQGDTLVSGDGAAVGIIFADKSTMSMAANGRIILDELVYNAEAPSTSSQVFNVVKGAFVFTSGAIGKADPEAVTVNTPVATIGIRGTKFGLTVDAIDGNTNVTVLEGAVYVENAGGAVLLTTIGETTLVPSYAQQPSDPRVIDIQEIQEKYGDAIGFHPVRQDIPDTGDDTAGLDEDDLQQLADDLNDIETAAGDQNQGGDQGANNEFIEIVENNVGDGTGPETSGTTGDGEVAGDGEGAGGTGTPTDGDGDDGLGGDTGIGSGGGDEEETDLVLNPGDDGKFETINLAQSPTQRFVAPTPSTPNTSQELPLDATGGGDFDANLTIGTFGDGPDKDVNITGQLNTGSPDQVDVKVDGFEELALVLGGGNDNVTVQNLDGTDITNETVSLFGGTGDDTLSGTGNTNRDLDIFGDAGNDTLTGGNLDDLISGGADDDAIDGGDGNDTATYQTAASSVTVDLSAGTATGGDGNDTLANIENVIGSDHDDTLTGDQNDNVIEGRKGDDTIDGGTGSDTASYANAESGVSVDLSAGTATGGDGNDTLTDIENATGSAFNDTLIGDDQANTLKGGDGNDTIDGGAGNDDLQGGDGVDDLKGGLGDDTLSGGDDNDVLDGGAGVDQVSGGAGNDSATFVVGENPATGTADTYDGGADQDTLIIQYTAFDLQDSTVFNTIQALRDHLGGGITPFGPITPGLPDTAPLGLSHTGFETLVLLGPVPPVVTAQVTGDERQCDPADDRLEPARLAAGRRYHAVRHPRRRQPGVRPGANSGHRRQRRVERRTACRACDHAARGQQ